MTQSMTVDKFSLKTKTGVNLQVACQVERNSPSALLFGWFMAESKHVEKYAEVWRRLNYNTITTIGPPINTFLLDDRQNKTFLLEILDTIEKDDRLYSNGLVVQFFSNGGSIYAPVLAKTVVEGNKVSRYLSGVVFDSGPGYLHYESGLTAIKRGLHLKNNNPLSWILAGAFLVWCGLGFLKSRTYIADFYKNFELANYSVPELYIYSKGDDIVDYLKLQELIIKRKERFRHSIEELVVEDAEHVRILVRYPEEYFKKIQSLSDRRKIQFE